MSNEDWYDEQFKWPDPIVVIVARRVRALARKLARRA